MANVKNLEKRLVEAIGTKKPFAIALTGEWGIGKTNFWKEFYEKNHSRLNVSKYSYVSLFGIDSIDALKFEIAISTHDTNQKTDYLSGIKSIFKKGLDAIELPKLEGTGVTLSLGKGLISSAITGLIGDTLICIDDIERLSENLDIKDVMGLVNHLSLEKNCQIIVILHEGKAGEYFKEYKEKVFDEVLVLDNSLSTIKDLINDTEIFPIYEKFYQTMGVKNLRFYQRVHRTYHEIIRSSSSLSILSKKEILRQILIIKLVNDVPQVLDIDLTELQTYFSESYLDERVELFLNDDEDIQKSVKSKKDDVEEKISKFYPNFCMQGWSEVVIELITNINLESEKFEKLLMQDLINEQSLKSDREKQDLMTEYHILNPKHDFNQRFFDNIKLRIDKEILPNLSFYCNILMKNRASSLSEQLKYLVEQYIEARVAEGLEQDFIESYYFSHSKTGDIFYNFLTKTIENHKKELILNDNLDTVSKIFMRFYKDENESLDFFKAIQNINEEAFKHVVWQPIVDGSSRMLYIRKILKHPAFRINIVKFENKNKIDAAIWHYHNPMDSKKLSPFTYQPFLIESKLKEVKQWTLKLLQERIVENPNSKAAIEQLLEVTNNLEII